MPYIDNDRREDFDNALRSLKPESVGELNYIITMILLIYLDRQSQTRYHLLNGIMGVLESVKQEFYRRVVSNYEDSKIERPESFDDGDIPLFKHYSTRFRG